MGEAAQYAIKMHHVTKTFGKVVANKNVDLELKTGEILALLGENGSGKTTLMNMLSGIYFPDYGEIYVKGKEVTIRSPKDSFTLGIGMIHQHFKLVDVLTAAENIVLGLEGKTVLKRREINRKVAELAQKYGFDLDPTKKVYNMSVSEKQTVEILKVLYKGADILILDEPTAVLTPQETEKLFAVLKNMKKHGKSIIIITHKLNEVMAISDRVAILRKGEYIGVVETSETDQDQLTEMMVGRPISLEIERPEVKRGGKRLRVIDLTCLSGDGVKALDNVSFDAYAGEILGIAGIAGSGQKELCETIAGLYPSVGGSVLYSESSEKGAVKERILGLSPDEIAKKGISMALNTAFGDGYKVYQNDVKQGLEEPCFLVAVLKPELSPLIGRRFLMREPLDIHYFPADPRNHAEMITVAETMLETLEVINLPNGEPIRGTSMNYEIVDDVLHFFVNYNHTLIRPKEEITMETLDIEAGTTGGNENAD